MTPGIRPYARCHTWCCKALLRESQLVLTVKMVLFSDTDCKKVEKKTTPALGLAWMGIDLKVKRAKFA